MVAYIDGGTAMAKSYPKQLVDWVNKRDSQRRDRNVVRFLAVREDVKFALGAGFAVRTIWKNMCEGGRIDFGYDTFLKYVRRYVRSETEKNDRGINPGLLKKKVELKPFPKKAGPSADAPAPAPIRGFSFNPSVKKEDLI
jgi:hypothetical protein